MDLREKTENQFRHPWELSRADCIFRLLKKDRSVKCFADIGAGDRFFTLKLKNLTGGAIYAVDRGYPGGEESVDGIHCVNDISRLPRLADGGIVMMDVLEHIEDDLAFLRNAFGKGEGCKAYITVPAFQFLFSRHDEFLRHFRRYNRKGLIKLLRGAGLTVKRCHYFYASLFFARLLTLKSAGQDGVGGWKFPERHFVTRTRIIRAVLSFDFALCAFLAKCHIYLPGLSLVAVCEQGSV
ncbi:MAG: class I SAM-dependent methyltransferase [Treponematales bacterium]